MKYFILSVLFIPLLFTSLLNAQHLEVSIQQDIYSTPKVMIPDGEGGILIGGEFEGNTNGGSQAYLARLDGAGNILWEKDFLEYDFIGSFGDIAALPDGDFIIGVNLSCCCDVLQSGYLFKVDLDGNISFDAPREQETFIIDDISIYDNGNILVSGITGVETRTGDNQKIEGTFFWNYETEIESIFASAPAGEEKY